jgi:ABC-type bacteriocin/lantibiotic exporter with double-glycine peptidase domain
MALSDHLAHLLSQFSETLAGVTTIRAFGATKRFESQARALVTTNTRAQLNQFLTGQWVSFNLDIISTLVTVATLLIPVILFHTQLVTDLRASDCAPHHL